MSYHLRMDPFAALADPVRRALLQAVAVSPMRVVDLAQAHPISRPAVSRHLRVLAEAGLVEAEDRGRERFYTLDRSGLAPFRRLLDELATPPPPFAETDFDGLDLEVRRTSRDLRSHHPAPSVQEDTA